MLSSFSPSWAGEGGGLEGEELDAVVSAEGGLPDEELNNELKPCSTS
jgi:hypothetical protein